MTRSLLPPRGIFIPTSIVFNTQLPTAVILTWIRLRCLAWDGWSTPPWSVPELASLLGIHPDRLSRHLYQLLENKVLSLRTTRRGKIILSFPEDPAPVVDHSETSRHITDPVILPASDQATPHPHSYFPRQIMGYLSSDEDPDEPTLPPVPESLLVEQTGIENYLSIHS